MVWVIQFSAICVTCVTEVVLLHVLAPIPEVASLACCSVLPSTRGERVSCCPCSTQSQAGLWKVVFVNIPVHPLYGWQLPLSYICNWPQVGVSCPFLSSYLGSILQNTAFKMISDGVFLPSSFIQHQWIFCLCPGGRFSTQKSLTCHLVILVLFPDFTWDPLITSGLQIPRYYANGKK